MRHPTGPSLTQSKEARLMLLFDSESESNAGKETGGRKLRCKLHARWNRTEGRRKKRGKMTAELRRNLKGV